jgi:hypothetical protein
MVAKLKSASKSQTLKLAANSILFSAIVFWLRSADFGFWPVMVFLSFLLVSYFKPAINSERFLVFGSVIVFLIISMPELPEAEFYLAIWSGLLYYLFFGIKNLIFLKKQIWHHYALFLILFALNAYFFANGAGIMFQAAVFTISFLLYREYYVLYTSIDLNKINLISTIQSFVLVEFLWVLSLFSMDILSLVASIAIAVFVIKDVFDRLVLKLPVRQSL